MGLSEKDIIEGLSYNDFLSFEAQLKDSMRRELMSLLMIKKELEFVRKTKEKFPKESVTKNIDNAINRAVN